MAQAKAIGRLSKEYKDIQAKPIPGFQFKVNESNLLSPWEITFNGPDGTPLRGIFPVATWRWDTDVDACGICSAPFTHSCPKCNIPGDQCPL
ncbi:MAG: hypothetical protein EZS28_034949, partial [Streblomastix strix]